MNKILKKTQKKIYQLIITRLDGSRLGVPSYKDQIIQLTKNNIGGFIIFGGKKNEIKEIIFELQSIAEEPLFIATDCERGIGQQIEGTTTFPCQMAVAASIVPDEKEKVGLLLRMLSSISDEANDIGINMPLIPVVDVNRNPDNPIICTRAFSDNPRLVSWFGGKYIESLENEGLISCPKHFPGHGDSSVDSHIMLPIIRKSYKEVIETEMIPFREAIRNGASSIMIGHLCIPSLDKMPASLSKKIVTDILKDEMGFDGLIITDALNMKALKGFENIPAQCINAGVDILLHPQDPGATVEEILNALKDKILSQEKIDQVFSRILTVKRKLKKIKNHHVDYEKNQNIAREIADMSITLVQKKSELFPIQLNENVSVIFAGDREFFKSSGFHRYIQNTFTTDDAPDLKGRIVLILIYTSVAAWKGSSGIDDDEKRRINNIIGDSAYSLVVSFGSPYILRHFSDADVLIAAYDSTKEAESAVIRCMCGQIEFQGCLPVTMHV
jgi:beta-glucosidase-like glycosyl hydrolase